jgi:spectrin beta
MFATDQRSSLPSLGVSENEDEKFDNVDTSMPPVTIEDYLDRKQQNTSGGKRATLRSWKTYYTVLSGQILCFFKDPHDFKESKAASPPILVSVL